MSAQSPQSSAPAEAKPPPARSLLDALNRHRQERPPGPAARRGTRGPSTTSTTKPVTEQPNTEAVSDNESESRTPQRVRSPTECGEYMDMSTSNRAHGPDGGPPGNPSADSSSTSNNSRAVPPLNVQNSSAPEAGRRRSTAGDGLVCVAPGVPEHLARRFAALAALDLALEHASPRDQPLTATEAAAWSRLVERAVGSMAPEGGALASQRGSGDAADVPQHLSIALHECLMAFDACRDPMCDAERAVWSRVRNGMLGGASVARDATSDAGYSLWFSLSLDPVRPEYGPLPPRAAAICDAAAALQADTAPLSSQEYELWRSAALLARELHDTPLQLPPATRNTVNTSPRERNEASCRHRALRRLVRALEQDRSLFQTQEGAAWSRACEYAHALPPLAPRRVDSTSGTSSPTGATLPDDVQYASYSCPCAGASAPDDERSFCLLRCLVTCSATRREPLTRHECLMWRRCVRVVGGTDVRQMLAASQASGRRSIRLPRDAEFVSAETRATAATLREATCGPPTARTAALEDLVASVERSRPAPLRPAEAAAWFNLAAAVGVLDIDESILSSAPTSRDSLDRPYSFSSDATSTYVPQPPAFERASSAMIRGSELTPPREYGRPASAGPRRSNATTASSPSSLAADHAQHSAAIARFAQRCADALAKPSENPKPQVAWLLQAELSTALRSSSVHACVWLPVPEEHPTHLTCDADDAAVSVDEQCPQAAAFATGTPVAYAGTLAVPLSAAGRQVGVLELNYRYERARTDAIDPLVATMASLSGTFLLLASQMAATQSACRKAEASMSLVRALAEAPDDLVAVLECLERFAPAVLDARDCEAFVAIDRSTTVRLDRMRGRVETARPNATVGDAMRTGEIVHADAASGGDAGRAAVCVPFRVSDSVTAVLRFTGDSLRCIGDAERLALRGIAGSVARKIIACRTGQRRDDSQGGGRVRPMSAGAVARVPLSLPDDVARVAAVDLRDFTRVARSISMAAKHVAHADCASVYMLNPATRELVLLPATVAMEVRGRADAPRSPARVRVGDGVIGRVAARAERYSVPDVRAEGTGFDPHMDQPCGFEARGMVAEPLRAPDGRLIAVLAVFWGASMPSDASSPYSTSSPVARRAQPVGNEHRTPRRADSGPWVRDSREGEPHLPPQSPLRTDGEPDALHVLARVAGSVLHNSEVLRHAVAAAEEAVRLTTRNASLRALSPGDVLFSDVNLNRVDAPVRPAYPTSTALTSQMAAIADRDIRDAELEDAKTPAFDIFRFRQRHGENAAEMSCLLVAQLIWETGLPVQFGCDMSTLLRFVLACRARYRNVPYHNWYHAVDVCQTVYHFLYVGGVRYALEPIDCFVLLIVALAHDLDHMGLNNSYHFKTESPLGILSSASGNTSVLEVHHCNLAVEILDDKSCDVFGGLCPSDRTHALQCVIDCILATDMAKHNELLGSIEKTLGDDMKYDKANDAHRRMAMLHVTKAADISNVTKPFDVSRLWGASVTEEFYRQGDLSTSASRWQADPSVELETAEQQLQFIGHVARPYFSRVVNVLFPQLWYTVDAIDDNERRWEHEVRRHRQERDEEIV